MRVTTVSLNRFVALEAAASHGRSLARRHPVATFVVLAYVITWSSWIPLAIHGARVVPGGSITHFPGLLGPAIAAVLTTAAIDGMRGVRLLAGRMVLISKPPPRFWLYALSPILFLLLALGIARVRGTPVHTSDFALYSGLPRLSLPVVFILVLFCNGLGEETGWRGFALPQLQQRFGPLGGALLLGVIWAGWHVPSFWFVEGYREMSLPVLLGGFGLGICAGSLVLARVVNRTGGSILSAALWHTTYNMGSATAASRGIVGAVVTTCVMAWATLLVLGELRRSTRPSLLVTSP